MVDIAHVPQVHEGSGAYRWIAIRGSWRYGGRAGIGILRKLKDFLRARCNLCCMRGGGGMSFGSGSRMDQWSSHIYNVTKWPSPLC